jgi:tetratricopeptide (TPR) repeat protein
MLRKLENRGWSCCRRFVLNVACPSDDESFVRLVARILVFLLAVPLLISGGAGLRYEAVPPQKRDQAMAELRRHVQGLTGQAAGQQSGIWVGAVEAIPKLGSPLFFWPLLGTGGFCLLFALWPRRGKGRPSPKKAQRGRGGEASDAQAETEMQAAPEAGHSLSSKELKKLLKTADAILADQGPEEAGNYLLGEALKDEAAELFLAHELIERVAQVRHDQNRFEEAAELYFQAEKWEAAGAIYAQIDQFEKAAECYLKVEKRSIAAEMYERSENYQQAGSCYSAIGFYRHAAQAYLKAGRDAEGAEALVAAFNEEGGGNAATEEKARDLRGIAKKAGELFVKLERFDEAESILVRGGAYAGAAKVAYHTGAYDRASELFLRIGRGDLAAKALDKMGDQIAAARARGSYFRDKGDDVEAVSQLEAAGEFQDAGDLYRKLERYSEAGESYLRVNDHAAAAEMFRAAAEPARAAEAYENCGNFRLAAESYGEADQPLKRAAMLEKEEDFFEAGKLFAANGGPDEAIRVLQHIGPEDLHFGEACSVLGSIFNEKGMHTLSIKKFEEAIGDGPVSRGSVAAYYELGIACEHKGDFERASEIYEKILSFDYHYKDVAGRAERVKDLVRQGPTTSGTAGSSGEISGSTGRYQVRKELGRGGMGVVYLARDAVLERDVAYKVLPEQLRGNANALQSFLREAKAAAQLNHPNIVTVYDAGESEHGYYLAMEFIEGTTLKDIVARRGAISPGGVLYILRQMAEALAYAHAKRVVHRDIKTANTMWTPEKQVKIMDFGLAKLMEEVRNATTVVSGTPFYMSPEQTLGRNIDHRTDLYSLGVTVFELATGELPFRRGNVPYHHVHTAPPNPTEINDKVPKALSRIILQLLEKSPDARYAHAREIIQELDRLAGKATNA